MKSQNNTAVIAALFLFAVLGAVPAFSQQTPDAAKRKPNVLFIMVDDLRPELACYGADRIISPNIDKLAANGMVFTKAYCQEAICMSSRNSLLSGYRPDTAGIWKNGDVRSRLSDIDFLPAHFKEMKLPSSGRDRWITTGPLSRG